MFCDSPRAWGEDGLPLEAPLKLDFLYSRIFKRKSVGKQQIDSV